MRFASKSVLVAARSYATRRQFLEVVATPQHSKHHELGLGEGDCWHVFVGPSAADPAWSILACPGSSSCAPTVLVVEGHEALVIAFDEDLWWFHPATGMELEHHTLDTTFRDFILWDDQLLVCVLEAGVVAFDVRSRKQAWTYSCDLITQTKHVGGNLQLSFMDDESVLLSLGTGRAVATQHDAPRGDGADE